MKVVNRQAGFDYELGDRIEAGIVLSGAEVKSVKAGAVDLSSAYAKILDDRRVVVLGMHIYPYVYAPDEKYDAKRTRSLLLHQKEIIHLLSLMKQSRRMLVPTAIYTAHGKIKLELALARGKKQYEKREQIKKRDVDLDMQREL